MPRGPGAAGGKIIARNRRSRPDPDALGLLKETKPQMREDSGLKTHEIEEKSMGYEGL